MKTPQLMTQDGIAMHAVLSNAVLFLRDSSAQRALDFLAGAHTAVHATCESDARSTDLAFWIASTLRQIETAATDAQKSAMQVELSERLQLLTNALDAIRRATFLEGLLTFKTSDDAYSGPLHSRTMEMPA